MRIFGRLALATAIATATITSVAVPTAVQAAEKLKNSKAYAEAHVAAQKLLDEGKIAEAKAAFETAVAAIETEDDKRVAGGLGINIAKASDPIDKALQQRAYDLILSSETADPSTRGVVALESAFAAYNDKDYQKAIDYVTTARQIGFADPQLDFVAGLSKLSMDDTAGFDDMRAAVNGMKAAGNEVPEQWYLLALQNAVNLKQPEQTAYWAQQGLEAYPSPEAWRAGLASFQNNNELPDNVLIDLYRLRARTDSLLNESDYVDYVASVTLTDQIIQPQEAIKWLQQGIDEGVITADKQFVSLALQDARAGRAADSKSVEQKDAEAKASGNSRRLLARADVALDQGRYDTAVELYGLAREAGADADLTHMRQGVAQYEMGNYAEARTAFEAVSAQPSKKLADYWILFVKEQKEQHQADAAASAS